jgi:hypothetical protein
MEILNTTKILSPSITLNGNFCSTAAFGDYFVVGARGESKVYLYDKRGNLIQTFNPSGGSSAGTSVSINAEYIIVGDDSYNGGQGQAFVYKMDGTYIGQVSGEAGGDAFGISVAVSGDYFVVGAYLAHVGAVADAGKAYVYEINSSSISLIATLTASNIDANAHFGFDVSIFDRKIIVGAYYEDIGEITNQGAAYCFNIDTNNNVSEDRRMIADDGDTNDWYGISVSVSDEYFIVSADGHRPTGIGAIDCGAIYIYDYNYNLIDKIYPLNPEDGQRFGGEESCINGDYIVAGSYFKDKDGVTNVGCIYLFKKENGSFVEKGVYYPNDIIENEYMGQYCSISDNFFVAGCFGHDEGALVNAGCVYLYNYFDGLTYLNGGEVNFKNIDYYDLAATFITGSSSSLSSYSSSSSSFSSSESSSSSSSKSSSSSSSSSKSSSSSSSKSSSSSSSKSSSSSSKSSSSSSSSTCIIAGCCRITYAELDSCDVLADCEALLPFETICANDPEPFQPCEADVGECVYTETLGCYDNTCIFGTAIKNCSCS